MNPALALTRSHTCLGEEDILYLAQGRADGALLWRAQEHCDRCEDCRRLLAEVARASRDRDWSLSPGRGVRAFRDGATLAGRYRVLRWLGRGGMGEVYEVEDQVLGEKVALKSLALEAFFDPAALGQIRGETSLARRVTHPNVCRVFDLVFHDEPDRARTPPVPLLTMELLDGQTLTSWLGERGPPSPAEAHQLARQVAAGLDAAHAAGVVHQDLKSDNIMLVGQGEGMRAVITDFGLAASVSVRSQGPHSGLARPRGTIGYIAPERFAGQRATPASDVYSFGVVLRQLVSGGLPLAGGPGTIRAVPRPWASVIERCLAPDPAARFPSAGAAVAALSRPERRRWLGGVAGVTLLLGVAGVSLLATRAPVARDPLTAAPPLPLPPPSPPIQPAAPPVASSPVPAALPHSTARSGPKLKRTTRTARAHARPDIKLRKQARRPEDDPIDPFAP